MWPGFQAVSIDMLYKYGSENGNPNGADLGPHKVLMAYPAIKVLLEKFDTKRIFCP